MAGSRSIVCGAFSGFCSLPPHPLLSTVYQCDGGLFFSEAWGLMAGLSGLPPIGAVSILELAANSGSSRMVSGTQPPKSDDVVYTNYGFKRYTNFLQCFFYLKMLHSLLFAPSACYMYTYQMPLCYQCLSTDLISN